MPLSQYEALVQEYFRDHHSASLRATIMNASGHYDRVYTVADITGEAAEPAPIESAKALQSALKHMSHGPK